MIYDVCTDEYHGIPRFFLFRCIYVSPRFGTVPVPALGLFFRQVLALGEFIPDVAPCLNGDPVLALDALIQNWVPYPNTTYNPKWWYHGGGTIGRNSPSACTGTLQCPSARTGMVPGW